MVAFLYVVAVAWPSFALHRVAKILHWFGYIAFFAMGLVALATALYTVFFLIEWQLIVSNKALTAKLIGIYAVLILGSLVVLYILWRYRPGNKR